MTKQQGSIFIGKILVFFVLFCLLAKFAVYCGFLVAFYFAFRLTYGEI
jgi:hypothetical protein